MRAEILGLHTQFEVRPARREDGTFGIPLEFSISVRPCWKKPARLLVLEYVYTFDEVAYYAVKST